MIINGLSALNLLRGEVVPARIMPHVHEAPGSDWFAEFVNRCHAAVCASDSTASMRERLRDAIDALPDPLPCPAGTLARGLVAHLAFFHSGGCSPGRGSTPREVRRAQLYAMIDAVAPDLPGHIQAASHLRVTRAIAFIRRHFDDPGLTLGRVAGHVAVSPCHLARALKRHTGHGFLAHLHAIRIEQCRLLLETTTCSIKEIAFRVGYNDTTQLCRHFKRHYGITPLAYRSRAASGAAASASLLRAVTGSPSRISC